MVARRLRPRDDLQLREAVAVRLGERAKLVRPGLEERTQDGRAADEIHHLAEEPLDLDDVAAREPRGSGVPRLHQRRHRLVEQVRRVRQAAPVLDRYPEPGTGPLLLEPEAAGPARLAVRL